MEKVAVIDLFAGAGGLSLGFTQTDKFDIKVAVESNPDARVTYLRNHKGTELLNDVCEIDYDDILARHGQIDVVIGGPPCQGFSKANRQKNHAISLNNRLIKEYVRAVCSLKPKVFVLENVDMLRSSSHRFYYSEEDKRIVEQHGVKLTEATIELVPPNIKINGAGKLAGDYDLVRPFEWNERTYRILNAIYKTKSNPQKLSEAINKHTGALRKICKELDHRVTDSEIKRLDYNLAKVLRRCLDETTETLDELAEAIEKPIYFQRMIGKLKEIKEHKIKVYGIENRRGIRACVKSYAVLDYIECVLKSRNNNYTIESKVLNAADFGVPQKRMRFIMIGIKDGGEQRCELPAGNYSSNLYRSVKDAIGDLEEIKPSYEVTDPPLQVPIIDMDKKSLCHVLRDSDLLYNHIITNSTGKALQRFEMLSEGENFHNLSREMKDTYTNPARTQNTIYLRLKYDEPSGTVVNVRKSMWIHPVLNRAISIREAARLQTFPDSYEFMGTKDSQYQQVGNAVPPLLARAIAERVLGFLD